LSAVYIYGEPLRLVAADLNHALQSLGEFEEESVLSLLLLISERCSVVLRLQALTAVVVGIAIIFYLLLQERPVEGGVVESGDEGRVF
jgi:hypothetical protein